MAISWSCANITKKVDPLVATTGKNRMCLSEFRGQVLMFHQNPDEPIDLRIPATNSNFKIIRYLKNEPKRSSKKIDKKKLKQRTWKNRIFPMVQKGQYFVPYITMKLKYSAKQY